MKNLKINIQCKGCNSSFLISPSREGKSAFCSKQCYFDNQDKRKHSIRQSDHPINIGDCFDKLRVTNIIGSKAHVECQCGNSRIYQSLDLIRGGLKSCGCENNFRRRVNGIDNAWNKWFNYLKHAAKHRNIEFNLNFDEVKKLCIQNCHYCNIEPANWDGCKLGYIASCKNKKTKIDTEFAESKVIKLNGIDRTDSSKSYTINNVVACCKNCNLAKLDRSVEDFKVWSKRLYEHLYSIIQA